MLPLAVRTLLAAEEVRALRRVEGEVIYELGNSVKAKPEAIAAARLRHQAAVLARALAPQVGRLARADALLKMVVEDVIPPPLPPGVVPLVPPPPAPGPAAPPPPAVPGKGEAADDRPECGMFCSLLPGTLVFGSTPDAVADTVSRLKGKPRGPSLAASPAYREACAERRRPDLFLYLDAPRLTRRVDDALERDLLDRKAEVRKQNKAQQEQEPTADARKARAAKLPGELEEAARQHRQDCAGWFALRALGNPAGLRFLASSVTIHGGDLTWRIDARMRPGQTSPLLDLLADRPLTENLLRGLRRDSFFLVALPLDPADTWSRLLRAADVAHGAAGVVGPAPTQLLRDFEKQKKVRLDREVFARVKGAAWGVQLEGPDTGDPSPGFGVLVLEAVDAEAARGLEDALSRLLAGGAKPRAFATAGGTVWSLTGEDGKVSGGLPAFHGRSGSTVILGWQREDVAAALRDASEPVELRDHPRALAALRASRPAGVALFSGRQALASFTRLLSKKPDQKAKDLRILHYLREVSSPLAVMPPTLLAVRRRPDGLRLEMTQPGLRVAAGTVIDIAVATALDDKTHKD